MSQTSKLNLVVVGAGIAGLSTAVCLQQHFPAINVTIVADKFLAETLSVGIS